MMRQITFKKTTDEVTGLCSYTILRLLNLPRWAIILGTIMTQNQYDQKLVKAEEEGIDIILQ